MPLSHSVLRSLLKRKGRREERLFLIEGPSLLSEALASGVVVREVRATREGRGLPAVDAAAERGVPIIEVSEKTVASLSDLETPPGIIAIVEMAASSLESVLARPGIVLLLAGVSDPGNAGTLVRAAEAFGASGVIFGAGGVDPYGPKVVRAAMGSLFRLPHALADAGALLEAAAAAGRPIVAADRSGTALHEFEFPARPVLAIGSERGGVGGWLPRCDAAVGIPHAGPTESLNAAVAGSIVLYEWSKRTSFHDFK